MEVAGIIGHTRTTHEGPAKDPCATTVPAAASHASSSCFAAFLTRLFLLVSRPSASATLSMAARLALYTCTQGSNGPDAGTAVKGFYTCRQSQLGMAMPIHSIHICALRMHSPPNQLVLHRVHIARSTSQQQKRPYQGSKLPSRRHLTATLRHPTTPCKRPAPL